MNKKENINNQFSKSVDSLLQAKIFNLKPRLLHGVLGIANESGEIVELLKREMYYNASFRDLKWKEELGDLLHFIEMVCQNIGSSLEELMFINMAKLNTRYKNGYNNVDAIQRDKLAELKAMEKAELEFRQGLNN